MEDAQREPTGKTRSDILNRRKELQHGMSEQNSMSLLAAHVLQLLLRRRKISAQRLMVEPRVPTSSSTSEIHIWTLWEMLAERKLARNFHFSRKGLGKSISVESFGNLGLMALNIYCTPAHQMPKLQGTSSQAATWFRCCKASKTVCAGTDDEQSLIYYDLQLKNSEMHLSLGKKRKKRKKPKQLRNNFCDYKA